MCMIALLGSFERIFSNTCTKNLCKYSGIFIGQVVAYITNEIHKSANFSPTSICRDGVKHHNY